MPPSVISKQPTSSAGPNRFLVARTSRSPLCRSPSNDSTTSTRCSNSRGPATVPSLVTWPTSSTGNRRCFATRTRALVTSRTCATPPATPSAPLTVTACTESRTSSSGSSCSMCVSTAPRSVSAARNSWSCRAPVRPARSRTWAADSSADTYRVRRPPPAHRAATSSSSVDLPTPGSPASSTTAPATRPLPSTRSSSPTPVGVEAASCSGTSLIGRAALITAAPATDPRDGVDVCGAIEPHAWHWLQRPTQRALVQPHSEQRWATAVLAMYRRLERAADSFRQPPRAKCQMRTRPAGVLKVTASMPGWPLGEVKRM